MKVKKKEIQEIIDSDGELIGSDDIPQNGANLETQANNTTDYNAKVGHQPYRYDMLGRFGFTLLPFFEGKEDVNGPDPLVDDIAKYLYEDYMSILEHHYKNPKKMQNDYRKKSKLNFEKDDSNAHDYRKAKELLEIIKPHFEGALKDLDKNLKENINENSFVEGKMLDKKDKDNTLSKEKKKVNDVQDNKIKKIAGLINKLDNDEVKLIKNLLETE